MAQGRGSPIALAGKKKQLPVVAVMRRTYLGRSETWIHAELRNARRFRKIVLTTRVENLDLFPWPSIYMPAELKRFSWRWWRDRLGRFLLRRDPYFEDIVKRKRVVLLHAHFGYDAVWALALKKRTGLPLVTTFHGHDLYDPETVQQFGRRYQELFRRGERFIVLGENMRRAILNLGCPAEKVRIIHLCVNLAEWPFAERGSMARGIRLLFCGRLVEVKGLRYVLEAMKILAAGGLRAELRVIGYAGNGGAADMDYKAFVRELGIEGRVHFLGYQPPRSVREEMRRTHIFLQPSVTTAQGTKEGAHPTTLVEAQATGCAVIATFHSDIPEVVLDGKTGLLVEEKKPEQIAEKVQWFVEHPEALAEFGRNARRHVEQNYNAKVENEKLEAMYEELLGTEDERRRTASE